jgi:hypothetical protein
MNQAGPSHDAERGGMTIGRIMDWVEARLEAIRSADEEEQEEQEREEEKEEKRGSAPTMGVSSRSAAEPRAVKAPATVPPTSYRREQVITSPHFPSTRTPTNSSSQTTILPTPGSPRSHPTEPSSPILAPRPPQRSRTRIASKPESYIQPPTPSTENGSLSSDHLTSPSDTPFPVAAGAKRRHAMMMMLDSTSPTSVTALGSGVGLPSTTGTGSMPGRRRIRNSKASSGALQNHALNITPQATEAMEVEEDGRERKRVARR